MRGSVSGVRAVGEALRFGGGIEVAVMLGLLLSSGALLGVGTGAPLLIAGGCGTWLAYAVERVWHRPPEDARNHPARVRWTEENATALRFVAAVAMGAGLASALMLPARVWMLGAAVAGACGAYVGLRSRWRGRGAGLAKPLVIALVWSAAGVLAPVVAEGGARWDAVSLLLAYRLLFLLANTLLADARDAGGDSAERLVTPATRFGAFAVRRAAAASAALALCVAAFLAAQSGVATWLVALDAAGVLALGAVALKNERPAAWQIDLLAAWPLVTVAIWAVAG